MEVMMATDVTSSAVERSSGRGAIWPLLIVSIAVLVAIGISVPWLVKVEGWVTGGKFVYLTLVGYLGASVLYVLALASSEENLAAGAVALTRGAFLLHTCAVGARWLTIGHIPLSNIYEMVLMFSWGVVAALVVAEWKFQLKSLGAIMVPVAALALLLLQVLPSEIRPLVPALQSVWLRIHVTLAVLSYAGFTLSFAVALLYLVKDGTGARTLLNWVAALVAGIYGAILLSSVDRTLGLLVPAWDAAARERIMIAAGQPLYVSIPVLGWPLLIAFGLVLSALVANTVASKDAPDGRSGAWAPRLFLAALFMQVAAGLWCAVKIGSGPYPVPRFGMRFEVHYASSPFLWAGMAAALFMSIAWQVFQWKEKSITARLPGLETLDAIIYKSVALSFPLLTLMIIAGAYWANRTWGSYWSWDPKENFALVTWLTYAGYLHMRLTRGWRGRRAAYFAILGFAIILFTFFGVTYLLPGLHAYA
jgi:ABC-type transport system involved in cytochrome c biogenesis permease subunit